MPRTKFTSRRLERLREERKSVRLTGDQRRFLEAFQDYEIEPTIERLIESLGSDYFANITLDAQHKRLLAGYNAHPSVVDSIADMDISVNDFKLRRAIAASGMSDLPEVTEGDEYRTIDVDDEARGTYKVVKRGAIFPLSMEAMANDELNAFGRHAMEFGKTARRTLERFVVTTNLDANPSLYDGAALVHADHNNALGAGKPLNDANLEAAVELLMNQTGIKSDEPIDVMPATLLVHNDEWFTARRLVESSVLIEKIATGIVGDANVLKDILRVRRTPYVTSGRWWVLGDPTTTPMFELGFFRGQRDPETFLESPNSGGDFERDAIRMKARHIYGGAWRDFRGVVGANF